MTTPRPRKAAKTLPAWAIALKVRRAALGKSQEQVALDSGILNQTTISELEGGRYEVSNLAIARLAGLARGLEWTLAELEQSLGLDFNLGSLEETPSSRRGPPVKPRLPAVEIPLEIPPALQEAMDLYGDDYPEMRLESNIRAISSLHRYGGTSDLTPLQWFEVFSANRRWLEKL